jgi:3-oxoadipate enol-lactonase
MTRKRSRRSIGAAAARSREQKSNVAGTFARAGSTLRYWTAGPESAPVVVCTHGITLDHGTFAEQVPALRDAGYRVITWNLRGHGASQPMGEQFSVQAAVEDLGMLLDEVGVKRAVLVGESFGGLVIQEFYRRQPQRVTALVLTGSPALGYRPLWHERLFGRMRPFILRLWPEGHLRRITPSFMSKKPDVQRYVARAIKPLSKADFVTVTEAALEGILEYPALDKVDVPVLVIHGESEQAMVVRMIQRMLHGWATHDALVHLEVVSDAGHLPHNDNPAAFNEILLQFLQQHVPANASAA